MATKFGTKLTTTPSV